MTSAEMLHNSFDRLRAEFPVMRSRAYLFAGGIAPLATPVRAALDRWSDVWMNDPAEHRVDFRRNEAELKGRLGALIGASPDELALTDSTSRGNNLAVQMIDAPPGSNVVVDPTTYPSALAPWLLQSKRDVELRCVSAKDRVPLVEDFERLVDEKTVAVSVSHVCRVTGFRHDLHALGRLARATGAYLLVDGAQSVGAIQLNVHRLEVDFLTFGTMKWLLGPPGVGVLWMRPELMQRLSPPHVGPGGTTLKWDGTKASLWFADTAIRHELSSSHYAGIDAALAGVNLLSTISAKDVEARVLELSQHLIEELVGRGIRVWTPQDAQWRAGVVAFETDDPDSLRLYLRRLGVDVWGYQADRRMRADPHVYNSHEDIDRLLAGLDEYNGRQRSIRISRHFRANMRGFLKRLWKSLMKRLQSPEPALRAST